MPGIGDFDDPRPRRADRDRAGRAVALHAQRKMAGDPGLHQQAVARHRQAGLQHGVRRAHAGMPGERHLAARAEDADAVTGVRVGRRKHEGGLGQPRPARDRLHGRVVESFGIEHHAEWIAGAGAIGEDVELQVTALRHVGAGLWSG